ncbi:MAG: eukaryotic-like serine/threonine-protein kinase [Clostridia bacterium]|nr:eukaryotic-like serine/threonine-protein kinase [Clostridia bacterium]
MVGKVLRDRYEIVSALGGGGMATVYRGRDSLLHRDVTIKILREQYASDRDFVERFQHEAQAVARLSHPNIVSIYDVGQEGSLPYLIMEYVEGRSLKEIIKEKAPLSPVEAIEIVLQICDALEHAHEKGIVHRDIKPHNILLTASGRVKVTDFGIAQAADQATLTYNGSLVGSVHYLAPEQARGMTATPASDIYALGVVMYEMLTGRLPFTGETPIAVALKHLQETPLPPRQLNPTIPPALERVVLRCLEKAPEARYPSAARLRADLLAIHNALEEDEFATRVLPLAGLSDNGGGHTKRRPRFWAWALLVLLFLGLAAAGLWTGARYYFIVGEVVVPPVEGLTEKQAMDELARAGLRGEVSGRRYDDRVAEGIVLSQVPRQGEKIKRSRPVLLEVSLGPKLIEVPSVIGETERNARLRLEDGGFRVAPKTETVFHPYYPAGTVVEQYPLPRSKQPAGTEIRLTISKGPEPQYIEMPNLVGLSLEEARQKLSDAKLQLGVVNYQRSTKDFPGLVIGQDIPPRQRVLQGSSVNLTVSQGPGPAAGEAAVAVEVPNDGKEHQIQIIVIDAKGEREVYNKVHKYNPQERVVNTIVTYYGQAVIRVFRDGRLVLQQKV